jgi:anti-sigma factor RsiW
MRCEQIRDRVGPLLDGEISGDEGRALAMHMEGCPACSRHRRDLEALRRRIVLAREPAPRALAHRVRGRLAVDVATPVVAPGVTWPHPIRLGWTRARQYIYFYLRQAAAVALVAAIAVVATAWWMHGSDARDALARDVLSAHVRALLQDSPVQIASLESHTVKPWFAGRLDFTPVVKDLTAEGFPLAGGRLDYVGGRRVAALVYRRNLHQISVFVWPGRHEGTQMESARLNGYNLVSWHKAGMTFWAISDLNERELRELQSLL